MMHGTTVMNGKYIFHNFYVDYLKEEDILASHKKREINKKKKCYLELLFCFGK